MAVGRRERRKERKAAFVATFGADADLALDLIEVLEPAWREVYGAATLPPEVMEDLLVCSEGTLEGLIRAANLGITDWRDLRMQAASVLEKRNRG